MTWAVAGSNPVVGAMNNCHKYHYYLGDKDYPGPRCPVCGEWLSLIMAIPYEEIYGDKDSLDD